MSHDKRNQRAFSEQVSDNRMIALALFTHETCKAALVDDRLLPRHRRVFSAILHTTNAETMVCHTDHAGLAAMSGLTVRTVEETLKDLRKFGYIRSDRRVVPEHSPDHKRVVHTPCILRREDYDRALLDAIEGLRTRVDRSRSRNDAVAHFKGKGATTGLPLSPRSSNDGVAEKVATAGLPDTPKTSNDGVASSRESGNDGIAKTTQSSNDGVASGNDGVATSSSTSLSSSTSSVEKNREVVVEAPSPKSDLWFEGKWLRLSLAWFDQICRRHPELANRHDVLRAAALKCNEQADGPKIIRPRQKPMSVEVWFETSWVPHALTAARKAIAGESAPLDPSRLRGLDLFEYEIRRQQQPRPPSTDPVSWET